MKAIKIGKELKFSINGADTDVAKLLTSELSRVNGKASSHTFTYGFEVLGELQLLDAKIENMLGSVKEKIGAKVTLESGGSVPNAYKYTRIGSRVVCEYRASGWYVNSIEICNLFKKGGISKIFLTATQNKIAVEKFKTTYHVQ